jgi:hypothetical protein
LYEGLHKGLLLEPKGRDVNEILSKERTNVNKATNQRPGQSNALPRGCGESQGVLSKRHTSSRSVGLNVSYLPLKIDNMEVIARIARN